MGQPSLLVDLRTTQINRHRGIPRYSQGLVLALARERPELEIACLVDPGKDPPLMIDQLAGHCRVVEKASDLESEGLAITHYLQGSLFTEGLPVQGLFPGELAAHRPRLGAIVYDLIPWLFPDAYLANAGRAHRYMAVLSALSRLDRLFAISESVRRDVIAIANVEPRRVVSVYGGVDEQRWTSVASSSTEINGETKNQHLDIQNELGETFRLRAPFWLYVGGGEFRKNVPRLLQAVGLLNGEGRLDAPLVIAGSMARQHRDALYSDVRELGLRPELDVIFTGHVSDLTLEQLFRNCLASVFPSLYEGLGLPVLESYRFGKPVLASDTSSLRELVPESCRFDPLDASSISDAMGRFSRDPEIARESLAFAPAALDLCRWSSAAEKIAAWLDGAGPLTGAVSKPRALWVATSLPPDRSGVASFTQRSIGAPDMPVTFFAPVRGAAGLEAARRSLAWTRHGQQREAATADVFSLATLSDARRRWAGQPVLFVLGNSAHHLDTLAYLLHHGADQRDVVHLHDVYLGGLLRLHFGAARPTDAELQSMQGDATADGGASTLTGPRLLVKYAGVRRFLVNSAAAAERLRTDLGDDRPGVQIDTLFNPVHPIRIRPLPRDRERLRIAHFGMLSVAKHPDLLVAACDLLAAEQKIELVLAGYEVEAYVESHELGRDYLQVLESPSDDELERMMASVDCAVQLRYPDNGESSGVVNQLLSLRRPVVCTETGSFKELAGAVHLVPTDVSPTELVSAIEQAISAGWPAAADALIAQRSPQVFEMRLREILELDAAPAPA